MSLLQPGFLFKFSTLNRFSINSNSSSSNDNKYNINKNYTMSQRKFPPLNSVYNNNNMHVSINQSINLYRAIVQRCMLQCVYAESKRNVLNVLTDGAVRQFSGREFQSLGAATIPSLGHNLAEDYPNILTSTQQCQCTWNAPPIHA